MIEKEQLAMKLFETDIRDLAIHYSCEYFERKAEKILVLTTGTDSSGELYIYSVILEKLNDSYYIQQVSAYTYDRAKSIFFDFARDLLRDNFQVYHIGKASDLKINIIEE